MAPDEHAKAVGREILAAFAESPGGMFMIWQHHAAGPHAIDFEDTFYSVQFRADDITRSANRPRLLDALRAARQTQTRHKCPACERVLTRDQFNADRGGRGLCFECSRAKTREKTRQAWIAKAREQAREKARKKRKTLKSKPGTA